MGGTAAIATGGTIAATTGGATAVGTGGDTSVTTGGTTSAATGGDTSASTGGDTSTATGGTTSAATGGGTSAGGGTSNPYTPACGSTLAGTAVAKGVACTTSDVQLCYKTCGPQSVGFKSETCTTPAAPSTATPSYVEQSGCSFLTGVDYSCYKIPVTADATCPTTAPQSNTACTVATCIVCGGTTTATTPGYLDSGGNAKTGFCVCTASGKWSCASATAWPCPNGQGC